MLGAGTATPDTDAGRTSTGWLGGPWSSIERTASTRSGGTPRLSLMTGLRPDAIGVFSNNEKATAVVRFRQRRLGRRRRSPARLKRHGYQHAELRERSASRRLDSPDDLASALPSPGRDRENVEVIDDENESDEADDDRAERLGLVPVAAEPHVADDHLFAGRMTQQVLADDAEPDVRPAACFPWRSASRHDRICRSAALHSGASICISLDETWLAVISATDGQICR